jgi:hypothetical protein
MTGQHDVQNSPKKRLNQVNYKENDAGAEYGACQVGLNIMAANVFKVPAKVLQPDDDARNIDDDGQRNHANADCQHKGGVFTISHQLHSGSHQKLYRAAT